MNHKVLVIGILAAALALGAVVIDGLHHQAFGWER